jgi:hypothetical protein
MEIVMNDLKLWTNYLLADKFLLLVHQIQFLLIIYLRIINKKFKKLWDDFDRNLKMKVVF